MPSCRPLETALQEAEGDSLKQKKRDKKKGDHRRIIKEVLNV